MDLIEPKEFTLACQDGKERVYILSKVPAMLGREILTKYLSSALPKLGEYSANEEMALVMLSHVAAKTKDGKDIRLATRVLVDNHIKSTMDVLALEDQMFKYNFGFFLSEKALGFFDEFLRLVKVKLQETLIPLSQPLSTPAKQPSTN